MATVEALHRKKKKRNYAYKTWKPARKKSVFWFFAMGLMTKKRLSTKGQFKRTKSGEGTRNARERRGEVVPLEEGKNPAKKEEEESDRKSRDSAMRCRRERTPGKHPLCRNVDHDLVARNYLPKGSS